MDDDEYYFSDLTDLGELSEDSETQETRPAKNKAKGNLRLKAKSTEFTIRGALKPGRMTTCSTEALYKQIENGRINLNPDYQRDVVWPESRQVGVIRTIFQNFPMNPVLFNVITHDDGTEMRTCIDGKQRLTSICLFRQGLVRTIFREYSGRDTGEKWWYCDNPKVPTRRAKNILAEKHRNVFDGKMVTCTEYQDLSDADEREIFQRVQLGVALTPAEKLRVVATPRTQFVRKLKDDFLNDTSALASLAWDRSRGSDIRCLAQTIQCIAISKTSSFQATQKWLEDPTPLVHAFTANIENTYRVFETLACDPRHRTVFAKISPVEFIHVGILVHRHKARLTLDAMVEAIAAIRADVRNTHHEIRNNSKVNKTMHKFIDE
ncbi:hypothetical protein B0H13DRAFT_2450658, partial [Mycena leptocephala]